MPARMRTSEPGSRSTPGSVSWVRPRPGGCGSPAAAGIPSVSAARAPRSRAMSNRGNRAIWPRLRASSRRRGVGASVLSCARHLLRSLYSRPRFHPKAAGVNNHHRLPPLLPALHLSVPQFAPSLLQHLFLPFSPPAGRSQPACSNPSLPGVTRSARAIGDGHLLTPSPAGGRQPSTGSAASSGDESQRQQEGSRPASADRRPARDDEREASTGDRFEGWPPAKPAAEWRRRCPAGHTDNPVHRVSPWLPEMVATPVPLDSISG